MKKFLLLLALLPTILFAQTPFGYHATWIFEYDEAGFQGVDSLYHEKDTVYSSFICFLVIFMTCTRAYGRIANTIGVHGVESHIFHPKSKVK